MQNVLWIILMLLTAGLYSLEGQQLEQEEVAQDSIILDEISIKVLPFREKYKEATGGIYLVGKDEIIRNSGVGTADVYNRVPGVYMASGALNTNRIVIRGIGSRTPYSTNRIRAYFNDIPLTSGDGVSTLEDHDHLALGSIEILKGPASALYGSGLGGVIRLNSHYPDKSGVSFKIIGETRSFGTQRYGSMASYKGEKVSLSGGLVHSTTAGFRENSGYIRNNAFMHALLFSDKHIFKLSLSLIDLYAEIPSSINKSDFINEPEKAGGNWGILRGYEEYKRMLTGLKIESRWGSCLTNHFILFSTFSNPYERRPFNILDEQSFNAGFREYLEYCINNLKMSGGAEFFYEKFNWNTFETLPDTEGDMLSDNIEKRNYLNNFLLLQWSPSERVLIDAGLNLNVLTYKLTNNLHIDTTDESGEYHTIRFYHPVWALILPIPATSGALFPLGMVSRLHRLKKP